MVQVRTETADLSTECDGAGVGLKLVGLVDGVGNRVGGGLDGGGSDEGRHPHRAALRGLADGSFAGDVIKNANLRKLVRKKVAENGDEAEIELWSDEDLRADYTPEELSEGA